MGSLTIESSSSEEVKSGKSPILGKRRRRCAYLSKNSNPASVVLYRPVTLEYSTKPLSTAMARYLINCECETAHYS